MIWVPPPTGKRGRKDDKNYRAEGEEIDKRVGALFKAAPTPMKSYGQLAGAVSGEGALSGKVKELMAFSISIAIRCEDCTVFHLRAALKHRPTRDEVIEALSVAIGMGGGPSVVYGGRALEALDVLCPLKTTV